MRFSYAEFTAVALIPIMVSAQCLYPKGAYTECSSDGSKIIRCNGYHGSLIYECPQYKYCANIGAVRGCL
ncbi:uncharacterized protein SETTUDRAFT_87492 [Exserohilum turcica Et28A]|uniref:Uncharacterized protein n=1 Tax=Exserohilum turcicum (strain 28A) TaxID=671987 RepID=R0KGZ7_EXST2|nr:uncharacterized protein SETTUDRAFT_87492 [Exserohilum turcica Et28A]EOA87337.1 hypothetical protein SETTUDRAFT_87492 [Exserohilum turcica Et28A]